MHPPPREGEWEVTFLRKFLLGWRGLKGGRGQFSRLANTLTTTTKKVTNFWGKHRVHPFPQRKSWLRLCWARNVIHHLLLGVLMYQNDMLCQLLMMTRATCEVFNRFIVGSRYQVHVWLCRCRWRLDGLSSETSHVASQMCLLQPCCCRQLSVCALSSRQLADAHVEVLHLRHQSRRLFNAKSSYLR